MDLLTALLLALVIALAHILMNTDDDEGGKFQRAGAGA